MKAKKLVIFIIFIALLISVLVGMRGKGINMLMHFLVLKDEIVPLKLDAIKNRFYTNPLPINNIGDPFILRASDGKYYCYATSAPNGYKVWTSVDLINWEDKGMAFVRDANSWAIGDFWAPEVVEYKSKYYMFFSARELKTNSLRIGVAVANGPLGPFKDVLNKPLFDFGYATIDASPFIDDNGEKYLYYSRDCSENIINGVHESHIYGVKLSDDMLSVVGQPVLLTRPDQKWEELSGDAWRWNEGPIVLKRNGMYYMFYSANCYADATYSIGYATSKRPLGPFIKSEDNPILKSVINFAAGKTTPIISGPGHNSFAISPDGKEIFIVYHTHTDPSAGGGNRQLNIDRIGFRTDGTVYVNGPTLAPQPLPSGTGEFYNVASKARVSVSSVKSGYRAEALIDGEFGFNKVSEAHDWVADSETEGAWIRLDWDEDKYIDTIILFPSYSDKRQIDEGQLIINDQIVINNVRFNFDPNKPGDSVVVHFPEIKAKSVKFIVKKVPKGVHEVGFSEIYVIGKT